MEKAILVFISAVILFSLINISLVHAEVFWGVVENSTGKPVQGAFIYIEYLINASIFAACDDYTNANGYCWTHDYGALPHTEYLANATYWGEDFGANSYCTDDYGNGKITVCPYNFQGVCDLIPPTYYGIIGPNISVYSPTTVSIFNISWTDEYNFKPAISNVFIETNYTGTPTNYSMTNLYYNTNWCNLIGGNYSYNVTLPAGTFYWKSYANDTGNNWNSTNSLNFTVSKAVPTGSQSSNPSWSVTYPTQTTVSCSLSSGDPGTILTLKRDGISVATGVSPSETITLGYKSGGYSYTCEYPETQNYSAATLDTDTLTVNKGVLIGSISGNNVACPASVNVTPSESNSGDGDTTYYLYRNNALVSQSTGSAPAADTSQLTVGAYTYKLNATGGTNYTTNASIATKVINVYIDNHAPNANADGPYVIDKGSNLQLNGASSSDPDTGCGDYIFSYQWIINNNNSLKYYGSTPTVPWSNLSSLPLATSIPVLLTVTDSFGVIGTAVTTLTIYDNRPFAAFTAIPNPAECNQNVIFNASSSHHGRPDRSIILYEWDFDYSGSFSADATGINTTHAYPRFAAFTAVLRVTDNNVPNKTDTATTVIYVSGGNLPPNAEADGPYVIDEGNSVNLNGAGSSDPNSGCGDSIVSYQWDINNDGNYEYSGGPYITVPWSALSGLPIGVANTIILRVTDSFGASSVDTSTLTIHDTTPPKYSNISEPTDPSVYLPTANYTFSINWTDNVAVDKVKLEFNGVNYTDAIKQGNVYSKVFAGLAVGTYNYKWYANDTRNNWNFTDLLTFNINQASASCSLTFNPVSPIIYETSVTPSCSCNNSEGIVKLYRNGSDVTLTENNVAKLLGVGTHNYVCNVTNTQNYTGASNSSSYIINQKNANIQVFPITQTQTYPYTATQYCIDDSSLLNCNIYRNGTLISNNTQYSPAAGAYVYKANISDNVNYTNYQDTETLTISKAMPTFSTSVITPITYGTASNYSASESNTGDSDCSYILLRNGIQISSGSSVSDNSVLGVGVWNYTYYTIGCSNYTNNKDEKLLTVNKALRTCMLSTDKGWSRTYDGTPSSTSCSVSAGSSDGTMTFTKNSNPVSTPDSQTDAGSFGYVCSWTGGANYSDCSQDTKTLAIDKATPVFSTSLTTQIAYGDASDYSGSESNNGDSGCNYALLINGSQIATGSSVSDVTVLGAGTYNYTYYTNGCTNYNFGKDEKIMTVDKAIPSGSLTSDKGWNVYNGTTVTIGYSEPNNGDGGVVYKVWRNGADKGPGETWTPAIGNYNYKINTTGGANYSATDNIDTETLVVSPKIPASCFLASSSGWEYDYGASTVLSCSCVGDGTTHLYVDGLQRDSWNNTIITFAAKPSGYNVVCNITEGPTYQQSSNSSNLIVNKASRDCSLATDKGWTRAYDGLPSSTSCSVSVGSTDGSMVFTMNSASVSTPDSRTSAGTYNYVCQWSSGANYSDCSQDTNTLSISKATPSLSLVISPSETVIYPTQTTTTCSMTKGDSSAIVSLFRRNNSTSNPDTVTLPLGTYIYSCNTTQTQNYTATEIQKTLNVNMDVPAVVTILSPTNNTSYYKLNFSLNFTLSKPASWIKYSLNNTLNVTITGPVNLSNQTGSLYPVSNGPHSITVYAGDPSGSVGYSSVNFFYCLGDVSGPTPGVSDGKVDISDVSFVSKKFGAYLCGNRSSSSPIYDPRVDMNDDCKIDITDVAIVAKQFGTRC